MGKPKRFFTINVIIDQFLNSKLGKKSQLIKNNDSRFLEYYFDPKNSGECAINLTVDKVEPYFVTIGIGEKILYEEYEGMDFPSELYIKDILESVALGKIEEIFTLQLGKAVEYNGLVKLKSHSDIEVHYKSFFYLPFIKCTYRKRMYEPWGCSEPATK